MSIFKKKVYNCDWRFNSDDVMNTKWFESKHNNFKNYGRDMELLLFYVKISHSRRIYGKNPEIRKSISSLDLDNGYKLFLANSTTKENPAFHGLYV